MGWRERLNIEITDLDDRIRRLSSFLETTESAELSPVHFDLLCLQQETMVLYRRILWARIKEG